MEIFICVSEQTDCFSFFIYLFIFGDVKISVVNKGTKDRLRSNGVRDFQIDKKISMRREGKCIWK